MMLAGVNLQSGIERSQTFGAVTNTSMIITLYMPTHLRSPNTTSNKKG